MKSKAPDSLIDLRAFHMTPLKLENSALGATSTTISLNESVGRVNTVCSLIVLGPVDIGLGPPSFFVVIRYRSPKRQ